MGKSTTEEDWERVGVALSEQDSACLTVFDRREAALDREALDRLKARMVGLKESYTALLQLEDLHAEQSDAAHRRAEAAEARVAELVQTLDRVLGTPCEQIRTQERVERLRAVVQGALNGDGLDGCTCGEPSTPCPRCRALDALQEGDIDE